MGNLNIANRYANALMKLSQEKNTFDAVSADIEMIYNTLRSSRELLNVMRSPVIKPEVKHSILTEVFKGKVNADSLAFVQFIVHKNREDLLFAIVKRYLELRDDYLGIINAQVISHDELTDDQKAKLKKKLEEFTKKKVRLSFALDNKLIGGFIIRVEDTVLDASLKHQLELLQEKLLSSGDGATVS